MNVRIGRVRVRGNRMTIGYRIRPVPEELRHGRRRVRSDRAGVVVGIDGEAISTASTRWHRTRSGLGIVGAVLLGPATWFDAGPVTLLFSPFAQDARLRRSLCAVDLVISRDHAAVTSVQGGVW